MAFAMALTDTPKITGSGYAVGLEPRLRAWLSGEHAAAQRMAGMAFVIRVSGAVVIFLGGLLVPKRHLVEFAGVPVLFVLTVLVVSIGFALALRLPAPDEGV